MIQWLLHILQNLGFQVSNYPNPIHEDIEPTIDIIKENNITRRVKHINVPINYVYEKYVYWILILLSLKPPLTQKI